MTRRWTPSGNKIAQALKFEMWPEARHSGVPTGSQPLTVLSAPPENMAFWDEDLEHLTHYVSAGLLVRGA
eukprot:1574347-Rhodomonas_salina.4